MNKNPKQHINIKQMNETACVCVWETVCEKEREETEQTEKQYVFR